MQSHLRLPLLLLCLMAMLSCHHRASAQTKADVELAGATELDGQVRLHLKSDRPFIVGDNYYTLCIGATVLEMSDQKGKTRTLDFLLTRTTFDALQEGAAVYLTYGSVDPTEDDLAARAQETMTCWSLGAFSHTLLK